MSFFRLVLAICSGTEIFKQIAKYSLGQALRHLFLLALLCSLAITICNILPVSRKVSGVLNLLSETFGKLEVDKNKFLPEKEPYKQKTILLLNNWRVDYFPNEKSLNLENLDEYGSWCGVVWIPSMVMLWHKFESGSFFDFDGSSLKTYYSVYPVFHSSSNFKAPDAPMQKPEFKEFIKSNLNSKDLGTINFKENIDFSEGEAQVLAYTSALLTLLFFRTIITILFSSIIYTGVSAFIFFLMSKPLLTLNSFRQVFIVATYTGFPAILVGSFVPAFELNVIDYQTIYLLGFIVYFFVVINSLEKKPDNNQTDF